MFGTIKRNLRSLFKKCLYYIFNKQNKGLLEQAPNIPKILDNTVSKKNKDIVFALDYSESMTQPGRLQYATKAIVTVNPKYFNKISIKF